jgi:hypothetical protein
MSKILKSADQIILSTDEDLTSCAMVEILLNVQYLNIDLVFANGVNENNETIPEYPIFKKLGAVHDVGTSI